MPREIERKFLLKNDAWRAAVQRRASMSQGYLASSGRISVRVRVAGDEAWLNIKAGGLVASRQEYEYAVPVAEARDLLALAEGPLIEKTRHFVAHGARTETETATPAGSGGRSLGGSGNSGSWLGRQWCQRQSQQQYGRDQRRGCDGPHQHGWLHAVSLPRRSRTSSNPPRRLDTAKDITRPGEQRKRRPVPLGG